MLSDHVHATCFSMKSLKHHIVQDFRNPFMLFCIKQRLARVVPVWNQEFIQESGHVHFWSMKACGCEFLLDLAADSCFGDV